MKATGITRNIDALGRIVIPIELRSRLGLDVNTAVEIYTEDDSIILKRYEPADVFTGDTDDLIEFEGKLVSRKNIIALAEKAGYKLDEK